MLDALTNFHLIRPWWLLLAPIIVGVWWLWRKQSDPLRGWRSQMDPELLQALTIDSGSAHRGLQNWWLGGWLLMLLAIAGPTWRLEPSPFAEDASPLLILLKASDSMDRAVPSPSPLERAKLKISDLADARKGQPLGLIAYAGSAHLVLPPTRDTEVVAQMAAEISPTVMPVPGDRLDLALVQAGELLSGENTGGTLLVIADSVEAQQQAIERARKNMQPNPVQFLALSEEDSPESETINNAARVLDATVQHLTPDDQDITTVAHAAARHSLADVTGKSNRWQEAGYWLVPLIVLLVVLTFRREAPATGERPA